RLSLSIGYSAPWDSYNGDFVGISSSLFSAFSAAAAAAASAPYIRRFVGETTSPAFAPSAMSSSRGGNGCGGEGERQIHVLAVDDSSVDRAMIARILRSSKYRVTTVDSGKKALELLGLEPDVNMIITDYWMPEMTGYELLKRVKESSELREIPVVIMSSENVPNRINRCLEEGAEDFLLKPVRPSDVSRLCSRIR
ncbi:hypothetical protein BHE74_00028831, partial [Ensete ventricosum]